MGFKMISKYKKICLITSKVKPYSPVALNPGQDTTGMAIAIPVLGIMASTQFVSLLKKSSWNFQQARGMT